MNHEQPTTLREMALSTNAYADDAEPIDAEHPTRPHIWIGSLPDYETGVLYGDWFDATTDADQLRTEIDELLAAAPAGRTDQWAVFGSEGFGVYTLNGQDSLATLVRVARGIDRNGPAFGDWFQQRQLDGNSDQPIDASTEEVVEADSAAFKANYLGQFASASAYVEHLITDLGLEAELGRVVPAGMRPYVRFNTAALGRDMVVGGMIRAVPAPDGGIWIFDRP